MLSNFKLYVEIGKRAEKGCLLTDTLLRLTYILTVSELSYDTLDRNPPVTPLGRMCSDRIAKALLIPSGQTHESTDIIHWDVIPNLARVFCIEAYDYVPLEFIKGALREEIPAFVY